MEYTLIRSRRRTLAVEITRDERVVVRAPMHTPQSVIEAFVAERSAWISAHLQRRREDNLAHPPLTADQVAELRRRAADFIPGRVAHWAAVMGLSPTGVKITSARTRFGSCSAKNSLCFSLYLMQYPSEAIDAVVVHELSHIRHKNHSPAFYREVERWLPDYRRRVEALKR